MKINSVNQSQEIKNIQLILLHFYLSEQNVEKLFGRYEVNFCVLGHEYIYHYQYEPIQKNIRIKMCTIHPLNLIYLLKPL